MLYDKFMKIWGKIEESQIKWGQFEETWGKLYDKFMKIWEKSEESQRKWGKLWKKWGQFEETWGNLWGGTNTGMQIYYISDNFPHFSITEENMRRVMKKMRKVIWLIHEDLRKSWGKSEKVRKSMRKMRTVWGNMRKVMGRKKYSFADMLHFR